MKMTFVKGVLAGGAVAVGALASSSALAGTGIGAVFNLGHTNTVNAKSTLTGATAGPQLKVTNRSTGAGATGLGINVAAGKPPLTVNSTTRVPKLNASLLGGKPATAFLAGHGTVTGTPGYVTIDHPPDQVDLGPVGTLGELVGRCENGLDGAAGNLRIANSIPANGALLSYDNDSYKYGHHGGVLAVGPGTVPGFESGTPGAGQQKGNVDTMQISYGNEVDTVTVVALDYNANGSDHCDFSAQVVTTTG